MTRERLEHPAGQSLLLEQTKLSLEAGSWTYERMGNVRAALLQLLFRDKGVFCESGEDAWQFW